jgi:hypothetical protein
MITADNIWAAAKAQYSGCEMCFGSKISLSNWVRWWSSWYGGGARVLGGSECPFIRAAERTQRMLAKEWSVISSILQRSTTSSLWESDTDIKLWTVTDRRARCPDSLQYNQNHQYCLYAAIESYKGYEYFWITCAISLYVLAGNLPPRLGSHLEKLLCSLRRSAIVICLI